MFGLPLIAIQLIGYALVAGGLWYTGHTVKKNYDTVHENIGKEEQRKLDAPEHDARLQAESGRDVAVAANGQLRVNLKVLGSERVACSTEVDKWHKAGTITDATIAARKPLDDTKHAEVSADKLELVARLGLPDPRTCEEREAASITMWKKIRDAQIRDFPPTPNAPAKADGVTIKAPK